MIEEGGAVDTSYRDDTNKHTLRHCIARIRENRKFRVFAKSTRIGVFVQIYAISSGCELILKNFEKKSFFHSNRSAVVRTDENGNFGTGMS